MEAIRSLCQKHHVKELYVFGSAVRDDFNEKSDIDFLIEYHSGLDTDRFQNMISLKEGLEKQLSRNVDLVEYSLLTNKYLKHFINKEKQRIFYA